MSSLNTPTKIIKVCIVGGVQVGKTNIRRILTGKRFKRNISPTIGSDFTYREFTHNNVEIKSMIWDLSGSEKFKNSRSLYLQGIQAGLLVFDVTDEESFSELEQWVIDIEQSISNRGAIPLCILANKSDLIPISETHVVENQILEFVNSLRERLQSKYEISYYMTSAATGENIEEAFLYLVSQI